MNPYQILGVKENASVDEIRDAYRTLARRWHPDRFIEGPERDWANEKMCDINAAYNACLTGTAGAYIQLEEAERLKRAERLISEEHYKEARAVLMSFDTRSAEWNYLFGSMLLGQGQQRKAEIYLGVASRQAPDVERYKEAYKRAEDENAVHSLKQFFASRR